MAEPVFFRAGPGLTVVEIATLTGAVLRDNAAADRRLHNVGPVDRAGPHDLTFVEGRKFVGELDLLRAGACLATEELASNIPARVAVLVTREPYRAFVRVVEALFPQARRPSSLFAVSGDFGGAVVDPSARIESGVTIDPGAIVGANAEIGAGTAVGATAVIGPDVRIGRDCSVGPGATVTNSLIGDRVILHPGCRIGQDGFGYLPSPKGHRKIPQLGRVILQDDVEVGANSTIDRGGIRDTIIGEGTKIDNLVQVGHNCQIGRHCIIVAETGISGSVTTGDYVMLGGQVGIADNVTIGEGAQIAAGCGVISDVPAGVRWGGFPGQPMRDWLRETAILRRMTRRPPPDGSGT